LPQIPQDKVEEVRAASDIVDVVSDYVRLKKSGSNFVALCPFHNEKTPSFNVNPRLQIYKCFGCSAGGDVFQFVMQQEHVGFPEAVRMLAERAGIALPAEEIDSEAATENESVLAALRYASGYYRKQLVESKAGKKALKYLLIERGLSEDSIETFSIGYAPPEWDGLLSAAKQDRSDLDILAKAGLTVQKQGGGEYDRFRDRIMFPILSPVGRVLGFGGRDFSGADGPKYINSPETAVYRKSRVLYGLFQAKNEIRRASEAYIVEGYTDVISLHQHGIQNVVASSGTALTTDQVRLLGRYCRRVILVYDADSAGLGAAVRGLDQVLANGLSVYALKLPDRHDPDSFVRSVEPAEARRHLAEERQDFVTFKYDVLRSLLESATPEDIAGIQRAVLESIALIPDALLLESYLRRASDVMSVPMGRLTQALESIRAPRRKSRRPQSTKPSASESPRPDIGAKEELPAMRVLPEERTLVRLMLEFGQPLVEFVLGHMSLDEFSAGPPRETAQVLVGMYRSGKIDRDALLGGQHGDRVREFAAEVLVDRDEPSENWSRRQNIPVPRLNEDPMEAAESAMTLLKLDRVDAAVARERKALLEVSREGQDVRPIQERLLGLLDLRKKIERREFIRRQQDMQAASPTAAQ